MGNEYTVPTKCDVLEPTTLADWITTGKTDFQVIDVRGGDFVGGHIRNCYNMPCFEFTDPKKVEKLSEN